MKALTIYAIYDLESAPAEFSVKAHSKLGVISCVFLQFPEIVALCVSLILKRVHRET